MLKTEKPKQKPTMKNYKMMFMNEDTGGDFGGDVLDAPAPDAPAAPAPAAPPMVDAKAFASELVQGLRPQEQPKQMSPEEARKLLNVFEFDDSFFEEFSSLDKQKAAFERLRDGLIRQADTIAQIRMQELREGMMSEVSPALSYVQQQRVESRQRAFEKAHPDLAKPEYQNVLNAAAQGLLGQNFKTDAAMFKALSESARQLIKSANPNFEMGEEAPRSSSSIPVTSPGGGGGGGFRTTPAQNTKSNALAILGGVPD